MVITVGASGSIVAEAAPKPISSLTLASNEIDQCKAMAICVMSKDLLKLGGATVMDLFERELRGALSVTTDREFIARITSGVTPITSTGANAANIRTDIEAHTPRSRPARRASCYWLMDAAPPRPGREGNDTASTFPDMTPSGGSSAACRW